VRDLKRASWILYAGMLPLAAFQALVLSHVWAWFVVPLGVSPIGIVHAMGLVFVLSVVRSHPERLLSGAPWVVQRMKKGPVVFVIEAHAVNAVTYAIAWVTGWALHLLMGWAA
jgi:hypothetical protein